jgi:membrane-associated phospholipid phosphatase
VNTPADNNTSTTSTPQLGDEHRFFGWLVVRTEASRGAVADPQDVVSTADSRFEARNYPRPPGQSGSKAYKHGGATFTARMALGSEAGSGNAEGLEFDLIGLFSTVDDADAALQNSAFAPRLQGAAQVTFLSFSVVQDGTVTVEVPPQPTPPPTSWQGFDARHWNKDLVAWPLDDVTAALGQDWRTDLASFVGTPPDAAATASEMKALAVLRRTVRPHAEPLIIAEAVDPMVVVRSVLKAAGLKIPRNGAKAAAWRKLRRIVMLHITTPVFYFKGRVSRARPFELDGNDEVQAMFSPKSGQAATDPLFPGHPSFPSGHATLAHAWAEVVSVSGMGNAQEARQRAEAIAKRREIAGLHYESDSAAGKRLAAEVVTRLKDWASNGGPDIVGLARTAFS